MKTLEFEGKSVEEAIENAIRELSVKKEDIEYEVLQQPSKGFLGFIGVKPAKIIISLKSKSNKAEGKEEAICSNAEKVKAIDYEVLAKKFLRDVLNNMNVMCEIHAEDKGDTLKVNLVGPDMGILIGRRGETLDALQYLLSLVVNKENKDDKYKRVVLDTENYRKKREETLIRLANKLASRVKKSGQSITLEPMNPYERRVIHSALQGNKLISTKSEGEEPFRKVVIELKK
ncbi:RNA-binding cell elongation regulator Jag/EloR [Clostridium cylindrosporum]|uniref:RNA-binding protein KhpB n=1 Tax=Clostridium cylindrosporum DSM 605 TaxID=1121307 RepID=A0A0J8G1W8_CLOCY|nr:RNA-binding cell elongation regulator Jag/EloR [Clostridium cylindrosporum]KMT21746.1 protein Jag [Clostridium cylindrosporum DSM 605]